MISVVCVYNDERVLENWLLKSLKAQTTAYEFIPVNNNEKHFKSAAQALNYGGKKATGKYIMFVHQDMDLLSPAFLGEAEKMLDVLPDAGVAGIIGMSPNGADHKSRFRNVILEHEDPVTPLGIPIDVPEEVQTVDECLFFIPKEVFDRYQFDEITCDNWHFYAVDYCLSVKSSGYKVFVLPLKVHHRSHGFSIKFSNGIGSIRYLLEFGGCLTKVIKKHKKDYRCVYTTNGDYRTNVSTHLQGLYILIDKALNGES